MQRRSDCAVIRELLEVMYVCVIVYACLTEGYQRINLVLSN